MLKAVSPARKQSITRSAVRRASATEWQNSLNCDRAENLIQKFICSKDLSLGRRLYFSIVSNGLDSVSDLGDHLIRMFSSFGSLTDADLIFCKIPRPTSYSWQAIMSAHALLGEGQTTIDLFHTLQKQGLKPCKFIFLSLLKAIRKVKRLPEARLAHSQILSSSLDSDVVLGSTLIDVYAKCGSIDEALKVFKILPNVNVVSWNAMINGFVQQQDDKNAFELFLKMKKSGIQPTKFTFSCVLQACIGVYQGMRLHDEVILSMLETDVVIGTALIDMYAKNGHIAEAQTAFDGLLYPDLASWNAIIAVYAQQGQVVSALKLFVKMLKQSIEPDEMTFSSVVTACASNGAIECGKLVFNDIIHKRLELDQLVGNSLIDMYAKCGRLQEAHRILANLPNRDVVSWNILIAVYAQQGDCGMVHQCLWDMIKEGTRPDERTFLSILGACSHAGSADVGREYFISMAEDFGITHSDDHFNCMADLLGRCGQLRDAEFLLESMPVFPDGFTAWTSLLTACDKHSSVGVGRQSFDKLSLLDPLCASGYVLMSNICAGSSMGEDALKLQKLWESAVAWKVEGELGQGPVSISMN